ncbi:hypothetical protein IFM89_001242 [Coptis chinensis]|uniref:Protein kinase domain-containing protein n=1 Tax=Coptis chinensis TaxID=261450 RepID=A0A835H3E9_9MAGN|nr:hypothetical protein IFM89_001242 [Coptis chinensis]
MCGNLKVFDVGLSPLSQQVRDDGLLHTTCGTPNFVAPEGPLCLIVASSRLQILMPEFTCPPWLSFNAMKLLSRILDPSPITVSTYAYLAPKAVEIGIDHMA